MRRKSERTKKAKASPEKAEKPKRSRTSRRKKASSSSEGESGDEASPRALDVPVAADPSPQAVEAAPESQSGDDKVWQVKTAGESTSGTGEIKKLKICLSTRLPATPEPEPPRIRKKLNRTVSSSDTPSEGSEEKRRSRHRSRRSMRESKDEADRAHEPCSEDEHKMSKTKLQCDENNSQTNTASQLDEPVSTEECPESTTKEITTPAEQAPVTEAALSKDEQNTLNNDKNVSVQADTTDEKNEETAQEKQRPKPIRRSRRLSRNSSEREQSPEPSEPVKPKLRIISEEPESNQVKTAESKVIENTDRIENEAKESNINCEPSATETKPGKTEQDDPSKTCEEQKTQEASVAPETTLIVDESTSDKTTSKKVEAEQVPVETSSPRSKDHSPKSPSPKERELATPQSEPDEVFVRQRTRKRSGSEKEKIENSISKNEVANDTKEADTLKEVATSTEESTEIFQSTPIVVSRKRRWGSRASKGTQPRPVSISTDILKGIIPDVKPAELEEVIQDKKERRKSEKTEKVRVERPILPKIIIDNTENANFHRQEREKERKEKKIDTPLLEHRKISLVKEDNFVGRPPSPPRHKSSCILFITNLVRPFTLPQLKNLLQRTGKIVPDGFWIDRIKSKCFVTYENEEQAIETRHALHGVTWPVSNPKTLQVDFSSQEALERTRALEEETKDQVSAIPGTVEDWLREQDAKKEKFGETEESKPWDRRNVVREWDMGKGEKEKEKQKRDERPMDKKRRKSSERSPEPARKFKKKEEEAPAKMLDDLFRKTKTIPCIYWLPLSSETIAVKEEQRRQHMAENERRMQELERNRTHRRH